MISESQLNTLHNFTELLLKWFEKNRRDLPWRKKRDPYHILVSEIMLQQTKVDLVIPIYEEFLRRFPTIEVLAGASLEQVRLITDKLGYTRRSKFLFEIAKELSDRRKGVFPSSLDELLELKGIGRYTAGAILSFAFEKNDKNAAIVDVNVERVISRIFGTWRDERNAKFDRRMWAFAEEFIINGNVWTKNQAIMDLGAILCVSSNPRCYICPMNVLCKYYKQVVPKITPLDSFFE
ncbi:adenine glycosylase [Candidatus Heimdallarchaeota archaeon B3_Heim]|nr:MAG: adenine glycosylase [Candidatus Heimdallarchaeota archaeon B3_Heim]